MINAIEQIKLLISFITPYDKREAEHLTDALSWLDGTDDVYRRVKPDIPPKHLVSYFVAYDEITNRILLVDHLKSGLLLPAGGHIEVGEDAWGACAREAEEELKLKAVAPEWLGKQPLFLTVTQTIGQCEHTDVSLWYLLTTNEEDITWFDTGEFSDVHWHKLDQVLNAEEKLMDPHLKRFVAKLKLAL